MKKFLFIAFSALITSMVANAAIVETKFKVSIRGYSEYGDTRKLIPTKLVVRYNNSADILSSSAKDDCLVIAGKDLLAFLYNDAQRSECISNKTFVVTTNQIIQDLFFRQATFNPFRDEVSNIKDIIYDNGKITNATSTDSGRLGSLRSLIRNVFSNATETQTISLIGRTVFTLKGQGRAKFVMELEPIATKILNH